MLAVVHVGAGLEPADQQADRALQPAAGVVLALPGGAGGGLRGGVGRVGRAPDALGGVHVGDLARADGHPALERFAGMLERHRYGNLNHCDHPIHTSKLEGVNNKIKVIKRTAYGFHDQTYFGLKIKQAFPGHESCN
jgi:hypothetical protein